MATLMQGETIRGVSKEILVNSDGSLRMSDGSGNQSFIGIFGEQFVTHRQPATSANFNYSVDTRKIVTEENNGASIAKEGSLLSLNSGIDPLGEAIIQTKESVRYKAGRDIEFMATIRLDDGVEGNTRRYGLYDGVNGVYVGYEGIEFGTSVRKNNVTTFIKQSDWNVDRCDGTGPSGFIWNFNKMNIVRITFGYLGIAPIFFQVYTGYGTGWQTFHVYDISNKSDSTHIDIPYLPIRATNRNNGNTTDVKIYSGSIYTGTVDGGGAYDSSSREFSRKISLAAIPASTNRPILVFHNKPTYQGVINRIDDHLLRVGLGTEGNKPVTVTLYKLKVAPIGGTWVDVDTQNSNMETNSVATIDLTGAEMLINWELGKSDAVNDTVFDLNLLLYPDEYAVFTYTSTGINDFSLSNRWSERF